jgi:hypothetical protein
VTHTREKGVEQFEDTKEVIRISGGLILNLDKGVHDSDYYLEVSVTNIAKLTTVITKKVCMYISS